MKKKTSSFIGIKTGNDDWDAEFYAHCSSLDFLLARCTKPQAAALYLALKGLTQVQIAEHLHISQPTVQQRLKALGWPVFKAILHRFGSKY
jgi:DNA-binding NarL/FixJ family response regulator